MSALDWGTLCRCRRKPSHSKVFRQTQGEAPHTTVVYVSTHHCMYVRVAVVETVHSCVFVRCFWQSLFDCVALSPGLAVFALWAELSWVVCGGGGGVLVVVVVLAQHHNTSAVSSLSLSLSHGMSTDDFFWGGLQDM